VPVSATVTICGAGGSIPWSARAISTDAVRSMSSPFQRAEIGTATGRGTPWRSSTRIATVAPIHVVEVQQRVFEHLSAAQVDQLGAISDALLAGSDDAV
jgi:hypothetical protein